MRGRKLREGVKCFALSPIQLIRGNFMGRTVSTILLFTCLYTSNILANGNLLTAYPKPGEGILSLLRRSGVNPTQSVVRAFVDLNKPLLTRGNGLRRDVAYRLPHTRVSKIRTYPIFGSKYENVTIRSTELQGCVYYVVSGHGGPDPGAGGTHGRKRIYEDEYAYDTSLRIARNLIERGAIVYIIVRDYNDGIRDLKYLPPDKDEVHLGGKVIALNPVLRLRARTDKINALFEKHAKTARLQRMIESHIDSNQDRSMNIDVHFTYYSNAGRRLAKVLSNTFEKQYKKVQPSRGYQGKIRRRTELHMLRETKPVGVLIELGNIRYSGDHVRFMDPYNRQILSTWIVLGLLEDARR